MAPLETNRRVLVWLYICPAEKDTLKQEERAKIVLNVVIYGSNVCMIAASGVFIWKNISTDFDSSLFAFVQICIVFGGLYSILSALNLRQQITEMFESLKTIYDAGEIDESFRFLARANNITEWLWRMYFKFVMGGVASTTVFMSIVSVLIGFIISGHFDSKYLYHPCLVSLPWNQDCLLGYAGKICFQIITGEAYLVCNGALVLLFLALCLHHQAFYEKFCHLVRKFDRTENQPHQVEELCDVIRFHNTVKAFFLDSSKIYSPFVMIQLFCTMIFLACAVFEIDVQIKCIKPNIVIFVIILLVGIATLFVFCYFGKCATESFGNIANSLYDSNWHSQPVSLQKYFVIMIQNAQTPHYYHGFNIAVLNLETFTDLMHSVFSYYMIFKTLSMK